MKKIITIVLALFTVISVYSETIELYGKKANDKINGTEILRYKEFSLIPNYIKFKEGNELPFNKLENYLNNLSNSDSKFGLNLLSEEKDLLGFVHYRFQQTINNIPVKLGMYIVHTKNGKIISMNGELFSPSNSNNHSLSETIALSKALSFVNASKYKWEIPSEETHLKWEQNNPNATYFPEGKLVFINKDGKIKNELKLAYSFNIYAQEPLSRQEIYVDANTGEVLWSENKIHHVDEVGSAVTGYSGTQTMTSDMVSAGNYRLQETGRGNGVRTFNCGTTTNYSNTNFTNTSSVWNLAGVDKYATDAHWGAEMTYDYYLNKHGRNSIDNAGFRLDSYVHYDLNYGNAFWDGQRMTYGDGSSGNRPFTALDIAGHEITHGLTTFTANLVYQDESGALNESFSDIFGVSVEYVARPALANWIMGEDLGGTGIRNMANPNSKSDPDTYFGTYWAALGGADNGGVHTNSGVQNFWYVLLVDGGSGTNDNNDAYTVNAIGLEDASKVAFRNLTVYLTSSSDYADARFFSIQATVDLFGACTAHVESVTNAWYAVGVGNIYQPFTVSDFETCLTTSCSAPFTVNFNNTSVNGGTFTWDFGDGSNSNSMNPSHTYTNYGTYNVELFADGGPTCGSDTEIKTAYITIDSTLTCNTIMPTSGSTSFTSCSGSLFDSGGPCAPYGANQTAIATISPTMAGQVHLTFPLFDVEAGDQGGTICNYDNLKIYDGPSTSYPLIGTYCNNNLPPSTLSSSSGSITILFTSDPGLEESGFQIDWTCDIATAAPVVDFTVDVDTTCNGVVKFQDISSNGPNTWSWDFGDGNISTSQNPNHTYTQPGLYTVQLTATNVIGSNTEIKTNFIFVDMPDAPVVEGDSICTNNTAFLSATGSGSLKWYNSPVSTTVINTGPNFTTPLLTNTTTYYVEDFIAAPSQILGKTDNSGGGGYLSAEQYLEFDVYQSMFLQSVKVYAQTSGVRTIEITDNNGVVINSKTTNITAGTRTVLLLFNIPPGNNYRLRLSSTSSVLDLYRNNASVNYPYNLNGLASIKNSSAGSSYYYYFYNWVVKGSDCISPRVPVDAVVSLCTDVNSLSNESGWISFFNHSNGNVEIISKGLDKGKYTLNIFNSLGQTVYNKTIAISDVNFKESINISNYSNGIYFIQMSNGTDTYTEKVLK